MRVALIGAGISSALIAVSLRQHYGSRIKLAVFEKNKTIGGRMVTSYENDENLSCSIDPGFQYLGLTKSNNLTTKFFQPLIDDHVIELFDKQNTIGIEDEDPVVIDYTVPSGTASMVQYFFEQSAVEMNVSKDITKIDINSSHEKFVIFSGEEQVDESDIVIVTIPVPELLTHLKGSIAQLINDNKEVNDKLGQVKYKSRFAVGLFYPPSITNLNIPWRMYWVTQKEHDFFRYLVVDNAKRNKNGPPYSLVAHTSVEFAAEHIEEDEKIIGEKIKEELFRFLPDLPRNTSDVKYYKWKHGHIDKPYPGKPGYLVLNEHPLLILAGDSFASDSLIESSVEVAGETVKGIRAILA